MADRVRPMKMETSTRGTETDEFLTALDPKEDHIEARGLFVQNDSSDDEDVHITRDASSPDNLTFKDEVITTPVTLSQLMNSAPGAEPVGFLDRDDSTLSFVEGTRTFTISPAVSSFSFYVEDGVEYEKTSGQSVVISDTEGIHYIYFDTSGTLQSTTSWTDDIILSYAFVAALYWDATNDEAVYIGDERHGIVMDGQTHRHWHNTFGTSYYSGLALNSLLTDENGSLDTHAQLGTDSGVIADEDIVFSIAAKTAPAQITVLYRDGASGNWRKDTATNFPVKTYSGGSSRLAWNEWTGSVWQQTEVSNNGYVLCHLFAVNDTDKGWIAVQGQSEYANIASAQEGASSELVNLVINGLPVAEFSGVATVIFQTSNSYSNTPKARTRTTEDGSDWIDWRRSSVSPVSAPVDALTSDTHKALRQLIHFISEGPAEGFVSGAYREQLPSADPFPTSIIWWESSSKLKKIMERTITWTGVNPTTDEWKMYDVDGTTNLVTVSDAISYSGVFETTRTRTITVS